MGYQLGWDAHLRVRQPESIRSRRYELQAPIYEHRE
jgi:hypothetical protein